MLQLPKSINTRSWNYLAGVVTGRLTQKNESVPNLVLVQKKVYIL